MHINNLGGPKGAATAALNRPAAPARSSFGALVTGSTSVASPSAPTGTNILSKTISAQGTPGAGFGAPYTQAMTANAEANTAAGGAPGTAEQEALRDLMKMSLMSFVSTSFNMSMNRPKMEFSSEE
ncbi:hypothetical protein [Stigmatella erecta]|uniref:Uncharacterized protein n=1 Tax=Stigmatella erecta TaxID=83460 RepID=A0A1I0GZI2_9BACT|nr:hypothetical protein [Stigmatella erecta]SET76853.1 hypothetical protein SAMN05443639_104247 [Stigmatella erecta]